ncbi:MAG: hypothetical protein WC878_02440 [Candidatus Paceibacterota bacterium]|jgi:uncharacterized membrane protein SpoIIM required for sporulation
MAPSNFKELMQSFINLTSSAIALLYAAAFAVFFLGVVKFIFNTEDDKKREEGKKWMVWGVIALFAMLTVWGLVEVLINTFHLSPKVIPQL